MQNIRNKHTHNNNNKNNLYQRYYPLFSFIEIERIVYGIRSKDNYQLRCSIIYPNSLNSSFESNPKYGKMQIVHEFACLEGNWRQLACLPPTYPHCCRLFTRQSFIHSLTHSLAQSVRSLVRQTIGYLDDSQYVRLLAIRLLITVRCRFRRQSFSLPVLWLVDYLVSLSACRLLPSLVM